MTVLPDARRFVAVVESGDDPIDALRLPVQGHFRDYTGVVGGIPSYSTQFGTTVPTSESTSAIQDRINNCPEDRYIQFDSGIFNIGRLVIGKDRITLRGAVDGNGRPTTNFNFTTGSGGGNGNGLIAFQKSNVRYDLASSHTNRSVIAGFTAAIPPRGSTRVTLNGAVPSTIGQPIIFNAEMGASGNWSDLFVSDSSPGRAWTQTVYYTGNPSGNDITFEPALNPDFLSGTIFVSWVSASTWVKRSGIENIHLTRNGGSGHFVGFLAADECWMLNCKTDGVPASTYHVFPDGSYRCEIRHCELYRMTSWGSSTYVINPARCSQFLIIDNYIHSVPNIMPIFGLHGSAFAYNYCNDFPYNDGSNNFDFLSQGLFAHGSLNTYLLFEANWQANHHNDNFGQPGSRNMVWLRNRCRGKDDNPTQGVPKTGNTKCFFFGTAQVNVTIVGNVLGEAGYHDTYERVGNTNGEEFASDTIYAHQTGMTGLFRKGNYNTASGQVPASEALAEGEAVPLSYLDTAKPSWYPSSLQWPPVNPANFSQSNNHEIWPAGYRAEHDWQEAS